MGPDLKSQWSQLFGRTSTRLILMIFFAHIAVTSFILIYVHEASENAVHDEQRQFVQELRNNLLVGYRRQGLSGLTYEIESRIQTELNHNSLMSLASSDGRIVIGNLSSWPKNMKSEGQWFEAQLLRTGAINTEPVGFTITRLTGGSYLLVGRALTSDRTLATINRNAIYTAFLFSLPSALLIAFLFSRMVIARMQVILSVTDAVRDGDLSRRISLDGIDGEFDQLGEGINAMLKQLESTVSELRMMTDGLAHDLRSPITRLKSLIEHAVVETDNETAAIALGKVSNEAETLLAMLTTALQISRAEAGIGRDRFKPTNVSELLGDLGEIYGPLAEDSGFEIETIVSERLSVYLHRELISQAIGNLIENALKYAVGGNRISLSATSADRSIILTIADNGEGIPPERHVEAQKRFGRLDPSRKTVGSGLGLSLVKAVAKLHGGQINLRDNNPGLRVDLVIML